MGLPIVASDLPALREIGGGAAIYSVPGDSNSLSAAIDRYIVDPAMATTTGREAHQRFVEAYAEGTVYPVFSEWILSNSDCDGNPQAGADD